MSNQNEILLLEQNKKIIDLKNEVAEKSNFIWIIGEVVKHSSKLKTESELAYLIVDMLIGIFGLTEAKFYIKQDDDTYTLYKIDNSCDNKFVEYKNAKLDIETKNTSKTKLIVNNFSHLRVPIIDFLSTGVMGILMVTHRQKDFFNKTKLDFFDTLSIQISSALINARLYLKVSELSSKDILTNCLNRRYLDDLIDYNGSNDITYVIFDLDNFKLVNDTFGHGKGDQLLVEISDLAINFFKEYKGRVIRYGGDEFIVILEKNFEDSIKIINLFREKLLSNEFVNSFPFKISASFGVANYPMHSDSLRELQIMADQALYKAKENGKDQIVSYEL
ncbi:sensor domain-containing diguanylate cyclase [Helicovermis profundi]|uniref:GGDEF domain-containing protein n=1 Tax=Helicovermis profundi TaxID=3065157 RepID=A0AAU9E145_9FIRM|nr:hypothetical protein HLPR_04800 [Clostridia bacterium S502]